MEYSQLMYYIWQSKSTAIEFRSLHQISEILLEHTACISHAPWRTLRKFDFVRKWECEPSELMVSQVDVLRSGLPWTLTKHLVLLKENFERKTSHKYIRTDRICLCRNGPRFTCVTSCSDKASLMETYRHSWSTQKFEQRLKWKKTFQGTVLEANSVRPNYPDFCSSTLSYFLLGNCLCLLTILRYVKIVKFEIFYYVQPIFTLQQRWKETSPH